MEHDEEVWKAYESNPLTHSAAHYLTAIKELVAERGYARVTDIARHLHITRGSCSISLKPLKRRGLVVEDDNRFLQLSEEGQRLADIIDRNDMLLQAFFHKVLGVDEEQAEIDACKIEHLLSIETSIRLSAFIECVRGESKAATEFLCEVQKFQNKCTNNAENCAICGSICFMDQDD
jgi:Mn-dependent DtxR family transcriptional regulator